MLYQGIELELPKGKPALSHSVALDMITGQSSTKNMEWLDVLSNIPWGRLKEVCPDAYDDACSLYSMTNMDYQICNGGIDQYFCNRYNEAWKPRNADDVELYDSDTQKSIFVEYVKFAETIFPHRTEENQALRRACKAFEELIFEEDAELSETVYCDEDEYIMDEETGEEVTNPDYFEPYEEVYCEDYIHNATGFDEIFYAANEYLEEIFELQAQLCCKELARELEKQSSEHADLVSAVKQLLPESAFRKPSLAQQIQSAEIRLGAEEAGNQPLSRVNEKVEGFKGP